MNYDMQWWANLASVVTLLITACGATVGVYGYFRFRGEWYKKRLTLERYLKAEQQRPLKKSPQGKTRDKTDQGQRTTLHLVRHVGLTEDEIIKISFESGNIVRKLVPDEAGYANALLFEYSGAD